MSERILVTGASGFIGQRLVAHLVQNGADVAVLMRRRRDDMAGTQIVTGDLAQGSLAPEICQGVDLIVHLAASKTPSAPDTAIDDAPTARIARTVAMAAAKARVPRLLVLSSVAATLAETDLAQARRYGLEKARADAVIAEVYGDVGGHLVRVRPPAVYGPGMTSVLATLEKLVRKGLPLPLGLARTKRPYIALDNLVQALGVLALAPEKHWSTLDGQTMHVHDGPLVSTTDLIRMIAEVTGSKVRLVPVPPILLRTLGRATGKSELINGALNPVPCPQHPGWQDVLGWAPQRTMPETLSYMAQ